MSADESTPAAAGYRMPAEWSEHAACIMTWPSRRELWGDRLDAAKREYAGVASAIAAFEPVLMVCAPGLASEVTRLCGAGVETLELPVDDSWARDNGPVFVTDRRGGLAAVAFDFNAWGERWHPYADDRLLPERLAAHLGVELFRAPLVLEGGSYSVDGEGTLITTEQCLLNPNRNPTLGRRQIEQHLHDFLGATTVIWLPFGHSLDTGPAGTDGHIDGVLQYVAPSAVLLEHPSSTEATEYARSRDNLRALQGSTDAAGRSLRVAFLDPAPESTVSYANHYLANGAVILPVDAAPHDDGPLALLRSLHPDREVVPVVAGTIAFGGGGPHCITQQVPRTPIGIE